MNDLVMDIRDDVGAQAFSFTYEGVCDNNFLVTFTDFLSSSFERVMTPQEFKTVLFCSNELLQNIGFYSAEKEHSGEIASGKGRFSIRGDESAITLISENLVAEDQLQKITPKLDLYNSLNPEDLKALYQQKLKDASPDDSRGGGIGFIEMIRKSKSTISYTTRNENERLIFILQIILRRT